MILKNPYTKRSLTATKNMLKFEVAHSQYIQADNPNVRWAGGTDGFGASVVFQLDTIENPVQALFICRQTGTFFGFYFVVEYIDADTGSLYFAVTSSVSTYTSQTYLVEKGRLYRFSIAYELPGPQNGFNTAILSKLNGQKAKRELFAITDIGSIPTPGYLYIGRNAEAGIETGVNGFINSVVFFNDFITEDDLEFLHLNNVPSEQFGAKVSAFYSLNQNTGNIAYDSVAQYNGIKITALTPAHGTMHNFNVDDNGTNISLASKAWCNLYTKDRVGQHYLKMYATTKYATVPSLDNYTSTSNWALAISVTKPRDISALDSIFSNQIYDHDSSKLVVLAFYNTGPYLWNGGGTTNPGGVTSTTETFDKPYTIVVYRNGSTTYLVFEGIEYPVGSTVSDWDHFIFGRDRDVHNSNCGVSKAVFYDGPLTANQLLQLRVIHESDEYKKLPGLVFDIDFDDLYTDGTDYFATDKSGNGNDAKLFGFSINESEVINIERQTALPSMKKALRFTASDQNYLQVSSFAPTDEKGYTYIIGFCLESNRNFSNEYFLSKRKPDNANAKILYTGSSRVVGFLNYKPPISDAGICNNDFSNYDTSKPLFFVGKEFATNSKGMPFGFFEADIAKNAFGWDDVEGTDLFIGADDQIYGGSGFLNGYIFHVSIYKGILSDKQIFDLVNNGLGENPTKMLSGCELYLNFEGVTSAGLIKDWSPQNRTVTPMNFSSADLDPTDPAYKFISLDSLR